MITLPRAACALIFYPEGERRILSASRRGRPETVGLPGGKCERGEPVRKTAIRELREETGVKIQEIRVRLVHSDVCRAGKDGVAYWTSTYTTTREWGGEGLRDGEWVVEPGILVRWAKPEEFLDEEKCPFAEYMKGLFTVLGIKPGGISTRRR